MTRAGKDIRAEAPRRMFERLRAGNNSPILPDKVDTAVDGLGLKPGATATAEQLATLRSKLDPEPVTGGVVQEDGKVRWHW